MGVGLNLTDGGGEPVETDVNREHTHHMALRIVDGLTVAGENILNDDAFFRVFKVGLYPVGLVEKRRNEIPVHAMVLVMVCSHLFGLYGICVVIGIGTEIAAFLLIIIGLEADAATGQVWIVLQQFPAKVEHKVGLVKMALDDHQHVVGCHLGTVKGIVNMQHSTLNGLGGLVPGFFTHHLARLREHEGKSCGEDSRHENHYPETQSSG